MNQSKDGNTETERDKDRELRIELNEIQNRGTERYEDRKKGQKERNKEIES